MAQEYSRSPYVFNNTTTYGFIKPVGVVGVVPMTLSGYSDMLRTRTVIWGLGVTEEQLAPLLPYLNIRQIERYKIELNRRGEDLPPSYERRRHELWAERGQEPPHREPKVIEPSDTQKEIDAAVGIHDLRAAIGSHSKNFRSVKKLEEREALIRKMIELGVVGHNSEHHQSLSETVDGGWRDNRILGQHLQDLLFSDFSDVGPNSVLDANYVFEGIEDVDSFNALIEHGRRSDILKADFADTVDSRVLTVLKLREFGSIDHPSEQYNNLMRAAYDTTWGAERGFAKDVFEIVKPSIDGNEPELLSHDQEENGFFSFFNLASGGEESCTEHSPEVDVAENRDPLLTNDIPRV